MKMTAPLERVLRAFLDDPAVPRYGYDLMKAAGLKSGWLPPRGRPRSRTGSGPGSITG